MSPINAHTAFPSNPLLLLLLLLLQQLLPRTVDRFPVVGVGVVGRSFVAGVGLRIRVSSVDETI